VVVGGSLDRVQRHIALGRRRARTFKTARRASTKMLRTWVVGGRPVETRWGVPASEGASGRGDTQRVVILPAVLSGPFDRRPG
jgi:hypothetical protein